MRRKMYPRVDFGSVGGPNFEAKISSEKERRTMEVIENILTKTRRELESITSISQTELKNIVEKSGVSEDVAIGILKEMGITVKENVSIMPETTSKTNATNNPKGTQAATESEEMKKKMAKRMDKLKKENGEMMKKTNRPWELSEEEKAQFDSIADKFRADNI